MTLSTIVSDGAHNDKEYYRLICRNPFTLSPLKGVGYNSAMSYINRHIALPQDHGSWVFILSPLFIGLFAGNNFTVDSLALTIAAMAAFLIRQPIAIAVKTLNGRRPHSEFRTALFWFLIYSTIILVSVAELVISGFGKVLFLAIPAAPIFGWHLYLVSKRRERRQVGIEILGTGLLAFAAPAAYWIGIGYYNPLGWLLWLLTWLQSAASIVYTYLRLEQRNLPKNPTNRKLWQMGLRTLACTTFNLVLAIALSLFRITPSFIFIPFLLQWSETLWGISHPAVGEKATRIGLRQLVVSILFTLLFIVFWSV
jgi:hypothetical protein